MTEQDAIKVLRKHVAELQREQEAQDRYTVFVGLANALAVGMLVLSTSVWYTHQGTTYTPWRQPEVINWLGYVVAVLIMVLPLASLLITWRARESAFTHRVIAWLAGITCFCVLATAAQLDTTVHTAPAFWFTVLDAVTLTVAYARRAGRITKDRLY